MAQELRGLLARWRQDLFRPPRSRSRDLSFNPGRWFWALGVMIAGVGLLYFLTTPPPNSSTSTTAFAAMGLGLWGSVLFRSAAEILPETMTTPAGILRLGSAAAFTLGLVSSLVLIVGRPF